jgi:hypothetical protein
MSPRNRLPMSQKVLRTIRNTPGPMASERRLSVPFLAVLLAAALALYAVVFCAWTRVSPWALARFLAATVLISYFPGRLLVGAARLRLRPLERWTLSLVLGMVASTGVYWICALLGVRGLFPLWPLGATGFCLYRGARRWRCVVGGHFRLEMSHVLLAALLVLILFPLFLLPMYYPNMVLLPDNSMSYLEGPADPFFHLAVTNELRHSVPPQVPFLAGESLPYHYAMHLLAAMLSDVAGLSTSDVLFRFLPTFFLTLTTLAIFCFARAWMGSGSAAALAVLLVVLGEDFSFIPGLLLRSDEIWSYWFFHVPTIYSCYFINPILPALAILFAGLMCLVRLLQERGRGWLLVTAFLFSSLSAYKLFTGVHLLAALAIAGLAYLLLFRDRLLLKVVAFSALGSAPFVLAGWVGSAGLETSVRLQPWPFIPKMLHAMGMGATWLGFQMRLLFNGGVVSFTNLALLFAVALPLFLVGSFGVGTAAIPSVIKALARPQPRKAIRFFLAAFIVLGPAIALTWSLTPEDSPRAYNNATWFYVQSRHLLWVFVAELVLLVSRGRSRFSQVVIVAAVIVLAVPSSIQYFGMQMSEARGVLDKGGVEALSYLDHSCQGGEVVLSGERLNTLVAAASRCRVPVADIYAYVQTSEVGLDQRLTDYSGFWQSWREGELRTDILAKYQVAYVAVDKQADGVGPGRPSLEATETEPERTQGTFLRLCFENEEFIIYEVL